MTPVDRFGVLHDLEDVRLVGSVECSACAGRDGCEVCGGSGRMPVDVGFGELLDAVAGDLGPLPLDLRDAEERLRATLTAAAGASNGLGSTGERREQLEVARDAAEALRSVRAAANEGGFR